MTKEATVTNLEQWRQSRRGLVEKVAKASGDITVGLIRAPFVLAGMGANLLLTHIGILQTEDQLDERGTVPFEDIKTYEPKSSIW